MFLGGSQHHATETERTAGLSLCLWGKLIPGKMHTPTYWPKTRRATCTKSSVSWLESHPVLSHLFQRKVWIVIEHRSLYSSQCQAGVPGCIQQTLVSVISCYWTHCLLLPISSTVKAVATVTVVVTGRSLFLSHDWWPSVTVVHRTTLLIPKMSGGQLLMCGD